MKLKLQTVVVTQPVRLHTHEAGEPCTSSCGVNYSDGGGLARYTVNVDTGECSGEVDDVAAFIDKDWWAGHCARVGARVVERLKDIKL